MGYRPGDVVTVTYPELGLVNQTILILNRTLSPQDGTVTITARSETSAKHAFALGQTSTPPPTPSVSGAVLVPTPGEYAWTITGGVLTSDSGTAIPVLTLTGAVDFDGIDSVVLEYRTYSGADTDAENWTMISAQPPAMTLFNITGLQDEVNYEVAVSYRCGPATGPRLILGPETCGATQIPWKTGVVGPAKPEDNATKGAPPGTVVGTSTADQVVSDIAAAKSDIASIEATVAQALTSASGDVAAAQAAATAAALAQTAAQAARDSASGYATTASSSASAAGSSAGQASASVSAASGFSSTASTAATNASTSAVAAGLSAAAAQRSSSLVSSVSAGTSNLNPVFASWTTYPGPPDSWTTVGGTPQQVAGIDANPYSLHFDVAAGVDTGVSQSISLAAGAYVVEVTADLTSATWDGAGARLEWYAGSSLQGSGTINFLNEADSAGFTGNNGFRRTWTKFFQTGVNGSINRIVVYAMANWSGYGVSTSAKGVTFRAVKIRPASAAEIAAQRADTNATAALSSVTSFEATQASTNSALTTATNNLTAQIAGTSTSGLQTTLTSQIATAASTAATNTQAVAQNVTTLQAVTRQGSPNLLINSDFSDGFNHWQSAEGLNTWGILTQYSIGPFVQTNYGSAGFLYQDVPAQAYTQYSLSYESDPDNAPNTDGQLYLDWLDGSGNVISNSNAIVTDNWVRVASDPNNGTFVSPGGTTGARIRLRRTGSGGTFRATRIQFQQGPATGYNALASVGSLASRVSVVESASTGGGTNTASFSVATEAGSARAQLTIYAIDSGGTKHSGVDIVGDLTLSGNAIVNGTIIANKFVTNQGVDINAMVPGTLGGYVNSNDSNNSRHVNNNDLDGGYAVFGPISCGTYTTLNLNVQGGVNGDNGGSFTAYVDLWGYNGSSWNYLTTFGPAYTPGGYQTFSLNISNYKPGSSLGTNAYLALYLHGQGGSGFIYNLVLSGTYANLK